MMTSAALVVLFVLAYAGKLVFIGRENLAGVGFQEAGEDRVAAFGEVRFDAGEQLHQRPGEDVGHVADQHDAMHRRRGLRPGVGDLP